MVKIFIGNIADGARNHELQAMFEKYGRVTECSILTNFGFVHMDAQEDADAAVKGLDGAFFAGSTIKVELSHGKPPRGGRGGRGGGRGGFRGGRGGGGRGGGGGFRDRGSRYDDYGSRDRDYYGGRADPYARDRYPRDPYPRDPYRDSYRDPYERRPPPGADPYDRAPRDPYDMYPPAARDPYAAPRLAADPYSRERSPLGRRDDFGAPRRSYDNGLYGRAGSPMGARRY